MKNIKLNLIFLAKVIANTKGMIMNYAFALFTFFILAQISQIGLVVYSLLLPYILVAIALTEGMEVSFINISAKENDHAFLILLGVQALLALIYYMICSLIVKPDMIRMNDWTAIGIPLLKAYSIGIFSAGFSGILRGKGFTESIYRINFIILLLLILLSVVFTLKGKLTTSCLGEIVFKLSFVECLLLFFYVCIKVRIPIKLNLISAYYFSDHFFYSIPIILTWGILALDRYMINCTLMQWGKSYVALFGSWLQIKPLFLFPAIAVSQVFISYLYRDKPKIPVRKIIPGLIACLLFSVFISVFVAQHINSLMQWFAPHLFMIFIQLRLAIVIDMITLPVMYVVVFSRYILNSQKKSWVALGIYSFAILVSRVIYLPLIIPMKSIHLFAGSFLLQILCLIFIPLFLYHSTKTHLFKTQC